jgi:hypothetical protein
MSPADRARAAQRAPCRAAALGRVEAEPDQRRDESAGPVASHGHGLQLPGLGIALDEERVADAQRSSALDSLQRADQLAFEPRAGAESVDEQLRG